MDALVEFNKKYEKLAGLSLAREIVKNGIKLSIELEGDIAHDPNFSPYDGESWDALILTYRIFFQNNDGISICKIKEFYQNKVRDFQDSLKVIQEISKFNKFLDRETPLIVNGKRKSYREINCAFIYGEYSHTTKKDEFQQMMKYPFAGNIYKYLFLEVIYKTLELLEYIYLMNKKEINILDG